MKIIRSKLNFWIGMALVQMVSLVSAMFSSAEEPTSLNIDFHTDAATGDKIVALVPLQGDAGEEKVNNGGVVGGKLRIGGTQFGEMVPIVRAPTNAE